MSELVVLSYHRVLGELSTGAMLLCMEDDPNYVEILESFECAEWGKMLRLFAKYLAEHPLAAGVFQRTDRAGLAPMRISAEEAELFRKDPAQAIQVRTFAARTVNVGAEKKEETINMVPPLTTGYDMRADFFGELVYLRVKDKKVECPGCGRWLNFSLTTHGHTVDGVECSQCECRTVFGDAQDQWMGTYVLNILGNSHDRFFLPRKWNKNGNWISRVELQKMLEDYLEEKAKVTCTP